jgi:hypothetical protein
MGVGPKGRRFNVQAFLESAGPERRVISSRKGDTIYSQGKPCDSVMYLQSGEVTLSVLSDRGKEAILAVLGPTNFFGEGGLSGQRLRTGTAKASAVSSVLVIEQAAMVRLLHDQPGLSDCFIAHGMVRRVGLIGSGQEIHVGEEAGLVQWWWAVEGATRSAEWTVHGPLAVADCFDGSAIPYDMQSSLNLDSELRFHAAGDLHRFVAGVLDARPSAELNPLGCRLEQDGFHLRLTRSLDAAREYLRQRYAEDRDARFGLVASSKDRRRQVVERQCT